VFVLVFIFQFLSFFFLCVELETLENFYSYPAFVKHFTKLDFLHLQAVLPLPKPKTPRNSFKPSESLSLLCLLIDWLNRDNITDRRGSLELRFNFALYWQAFLAT
jgi:hypothetical protein